MFTCTSCRHPVTSTDHHRVRTAFDDSPELEERAAELHGLAHLTGLEPACFDADGNAAVCPRCAGLSLRHATVEAAIEAAKARAAQDGDDMGVIATEDGDYVVGDHGDSMTLWYGYPVLYFVRPDGTVTKSLEQEAEGHAG